jgi:hypothetical protein
MHGRSRRGRGPAVQQFVVGNLQGDPGDSLIIELVGPKRGLWIDFDTGESGDVLALWACGRGDTLPGDGPRLQAGPVAERAGRSGRQRAGGVRHRAPGALGCRAARWRLSVPGFPVPGWEGKAGCEPGCSPQRG